MMPRIREDQGMDLARLRPILVAAWYGLFGLIVASPAWAQQERGDAPAGQETEADSPDDNVPDEVAEAAQPPSRVDRLIDSLDTSKVNLSGADLDVEIIGDQLFLRGTGEDLDLVEALIQLLEETSEKKELRVVTVTEKDANEIARTVEPAIRDALFDPNQRSEDEVSVTALSANILLVSALPQHIDFVVGVIKQVDQVKPEIPDVEQLVFPIQHRKASDVAEQLQEIVRKMQEKKGATGAEGEIQIVPNNANNSIMILAPETERAKFQKLIKELDVEPVEGWGDVRLTLYPLLHSKARELAEVINNLIESQEQREAAEEMIYRLTMSKSLPSGELIELSPIDLQKPLRIISDEGTNSLIVATVEENVEPMGELIRLMDSVPLAVNLDVKLFPLRFADAEKVANMLEQMFEEAGTLLEDPDGSGADGVPQDEPGKSLVYKVGIAPDVRSNTLIVSGRPEQIALAERVVKALDRPVDTKELRVVTVKQKDANEVAQSVETALQDALGEPEQRPEDEIKVTALSSNILLVSALPRHIDFVVAVIERVDQVENPLPQLEQLVFPIEHRVAGELAEQLTEILQKMQEKRGAGGAEAEIQIIANNANNSVMILAPDEDRDKLRKLIDQLDVEPTRKWGEVKLTLYPLLHSKADELAGVLEDLIESQEQREAAEEVIYRLSMTRALPTGEFEELPPIDLQKPLRIVADQGTNSLIVATVEENVRPMGELIRLMDSVPLAVDLEVRLFPLRFADAETVGNMLSEMFDQSTALTEDPDGSGAQGVPSEGPGKALVYKIGIASDIRTNTLIISGRKEQINLAQRIVRQLDQPATALKFPLRLIQLGYADATRIAQMLTELFDQRIETLQATNAERAALERERVFLSVDIRSNSLIVSASEENFDEIVTIVRQLDTKPAQLFDQIRIIRCDRLSAVDLKEKIGELWQRKADLRSQEELPEDTPVIVADERSNSLVIASSVEDFEEVQQLIEALEAQPLIDDMRLFKLEFADATVVSEMLEQLFEGIQSASEAFKAPTILPDPRSNALVVAASRDVMERVEDIVGRLDVEAGPLTAIFKVYSLTHGSASKLAPRMQELFDSRSEGLDGTRTPIVILADEPSNSLVCSASRDDHAVVVDLLALLDRPSTIARQMEIFPLKMAKAATVAEKLATLFESQAEGSPGRADAIAAEADERTNSIIVWASPSEMENVADVIARLDTSAPAVEMMIKIIQLKQALAEDFATLLEETLIGDDGGGGDDERAVIVSWTQKDERGRESVRKLLRQDVNIQADPRTNSLMVMAPADSMAMLEAMIVEFDRIRPIRSELRLFPLINSDAETMINQLTELFEQGEGADGETRSQLVFGGEFPDLDLAAVGQELRFTADPRTNTIIAAGAEVDLRMVEELIAYLDSQEAENRITEVYQTKYRDGQDIASAVQGFIQQEQDVLGELDDEEARMRRMERQVSVEAIGGEEEGSSSLIVGTSRHNYTQTMEMITQLDRPEPQVMISVLIAEVKLSDSVELGIEIAGQDLHFSEDAVLGPNGIIQGKGFDYVGGTDLGAAGLGLGGFNFTVTGEDFSFLLHAMQQNSRVEVLSRPILMVRNGEEGNITIADQVPIVESSRLSDTGQTQSTIGREDVGIVLTATPHISPDGYVTIEMKQEISSISGENIQLTEGVSSPVFSTREVTTNVTVRDGETVVIGGLIQRRHSDGENKVPILGDLPLIGPLFRSTSVSESETELLVVLTVDVLRSDEDVRERSVWEQREMYHFPPKMNQSSLLEGLRILPRDTSLGPADRGSEDVSRPEPSREERNLYGPKPQTYGPVILRSETKTTAERPVFGPSVVRNGLSG